MSENIKLYGYDGLNLGLTALHNKDNYEIVKDISNIIPIISFHGTSPKYSVRNNIDYKELLVKDKFVADLF